jgi:hypothetical protein
MKNHLLFLLIIIPLCQTNAQDYDLIVKSNGDSIACRIDSISDSHIYFEMRNRGHWIHTNILQSDVVEYKRNVISKKTVAFKPGTSYITQEPEAANSIKDIQRNSVYVGILSLSYSRLIPGDRIGFTLSGGLSFVPTLFDDGIGIMAETTVLIGGTKHFFEPGIMAYFDDENIAPLIRTSYRYQGPEGFLFRAGLLFNFMDGFGAGPALSLGYSF